ncbi:MAG: NAD(P)H-dependent glycerol-3-phosphate dehydrogenase [Amphiplicatus sp.]
MSAPFKTLSVIGGGAWGTALAQLAAFNGARTTLWAREPEVAAAVALKRENTVFLPGVRLHEGISATAILQEAAAAEAFLLAAPAQHTRAIAAAVGPLARRGAAVALCSKGVERETGLLLTEVLQAAWPTARPAVLSGPSFARDVARGLPTAVTLACPDRDLGARWLATLGAPHFRPYLSDDLVGAELGGAVKNVLAIAAGVVEGRRFGDSARAAVIARGFAEFQRLGLALGARRETMAGLSGLGDLILTATSRQSRNMALGAALGEGKPIAEALAGQNAVVEGAATAPALVTLAKKARVDMPIANAVADLVSGARRVDEVVADLLARPFREEND